MRGVSSVASVTLHAALGAVFLFGTTKTAPPPTEARAESVVVVLPEPDRDAPPTGVPLAVPNIGMHVIDPLGLPSSLPDVGALTPIPFSTAWSPHPGNGGGPVNAGTVFAEEAPEILSGPLPAYPDLLRQAGAEGVVVLEARVDSTGRVLGASISVVSATHSGFVEPARRALIATLFRPARVNGRAVPTLVRVPFAFSIRGGTGRAR